MRANPGAADGIVNIATCNVHYTGWPRPVRYTFTTVEQLLDDFERDIADWR
jgi:hypothetical protein